MSEDHLQEALDEYNVRVSELESAGTEEELMEAYINRGTVLMMMDYTVAAISDFDDAVEIIEDMEKCGSEPDLGLFIRAYENRGQMYCGNDDSVMVSDYSKIAAKLNVLNNTTRYFKNKDIIQMCINCTEDLIDEGFFENTMPFLDKASNLLNGKHDSWALNRSAEIESLYGESCEGRSLHDQAEMHYTAAIITGTRLYDERRYENRYQLILDRVARGDIRHIKGDTSGFIEDYSQASILLEDMLRTGESDDSELYVSLCKGIASQYMEMGKIPESEKFLLKAMKFSNPEMRRAMTDMGLER